METNQFVVLHHLLSRVVREKHRVCLVAWLEPWPGFHNATWACFGCLYGPLSQASTVHLRGDSQACWKLRGCSFPQSQAWLERGKHLIHCRSLLHHRHACSQLHLHPRASAPSLLHLHMLVRRRTSTFSMLAAAGPLGRARVRAAATRPWARAAARCGCVAASLREARCTAVVSLELDASGSRGAAVNSGAHAADSGELTQRR